MQSEDRIHRKGMDENLGCTIVDLIHLPSDGRVLDVIAPATIVAEASESECRWAKSLQGV